MSKSKELYISDLDGTLLNKEAKISLYTKKIINELITKGLHFTIATARSINPTVEMLDGINLNVPVILLNGALIYDLNKKSLVKVNRLSKEISKIIIETIQKFNITAYMSEIGKTGELKMYHYFSRQDIHPYLLERSIKYNSINPEKGLSSMLSNNLVYFTLIDSYEHLKPVYDCLVNYEDVKVEFYENVYKPEFWFLEVFHKDSSKKSAIEYLKEQYHYEKLIGFGDNYNDLSLFETCDITVAVENAVDELKQKADFICKSNNDDGVAKWIEETFGKI